MKKIVVFGASGDVGSGFIRYCLDNCGETDFEIIASGSRERPATLPESVQYVKIDITKKNDFKALPERIFAVVDFAGLMPARMKGYEPQRYIDVNITGTLNVLDYCIKSKADRILYAHSFGDIKDHAEESLLLKPEMTRSFNLTNDHAVYVMTKDFAVDLIEQYRAQYGLKSFIFRMPTIYLWSPIDSFFVDGKLRKIGYRLLIDRAIKGETIEIWGDKTRKKDMVYIKDMAQMYFRALSIERDHGFYNVGTGIGTSLEDQIKGIVAVFSDQDKPSVITERPDLPNAPQYIMDISNAREELGYSPRYDYISMLKDMRRDMLEGEKNG